MVRTQDNIICQNCSNADHENQKCSILFEETENPIRYDDGTITYPTYEILFQNVDDNFDCGHYNEA